MRQPLRPLTKSLRQFVSWGARWGRRQLKWGIVPLLLEVSSCGNAPDQAASQPKGSPVAAVPAAAPLPVADPLTLVRQILGAAAADTVRHGGLLTVPDVVAAYDSAQMLFWTTDSALTTPAKDLLALVERAPEYGLNPATYRRNRLQALADSLELPALAPATLARARASFDLLLTDAVLALMRHLHRGRLRPNTPSALEKKTNRLLQPVRLLRQALAAGNLPEAILALQPPNREYQALQRALAVWLREPAADSTPERRRLFERAAVNLERWRWEPIADTAYLLINLPTFELTLQGERRVWATHRAIVGKPETPTPTLSSRLGYFTTAPEWKVPNSIITKEILPHLRRDPGFLARHNYALYSEAGTLVDPATVNWQRVEAAHFPYSVRQMAGCDNSLGTVVFRFANPYDIYLHDTPLRQYFAWPKRAFSHGCVRVEKPLALAALLLRRDGQDTVQLPNDAECAAQPRPRDYRLKRAVPLHIRYATCVADEGKLRLLPDVYRRDSVVLRQLFPVIR